MIAFFLQPFDVSHPQYLAFSKAQGQENTAQSMESVA